MTKRIYFLTILLLVTSLGLYAQQRTIHSVPERTVKFSIPTFDVQSRVTMDTIFYPVADETCGNFVTVYTVDPSDGGGYVSGTNGYGDLEKAQRLVYEANGPYKILEIWGFFAEAAAVNNGALRMKVYSVDPLTGGPDSLLSQSNDLKTRDLKTDPQGVPATVFSLSNPVTIRNDTFFVSCDFSDLYAARDTAALFMTNDSCGFGTDAWELFEDGTTWASIDDSYGLDANWIVAAVVQFDEATDVNDPFVAQRGLQLFPASPNPTNDWINLPYHIENSSRVTIEVYATDGKLIQRLHRGQQQPGRYTEKLNVQSLPAGTYVYGIVTDEARIMSRFIVNR